jgi:hypothetical protein
MQSGVGPRVGFEIAHNLRNPRAGHHHAERARRSVLQHPLDSEVGIGGHSGVVHVEDQDAVGALPSQPFRERRSGLGIGADA